MTDVATPVECYSQYGEDILAHHILDALGIRAGCFVDVGSGHPIEYNNTYFFYRLGWRGLSVEPDSSFQQLYERERPGDTFRSAAVGTASGKLPYYRFSPYFYSTCEKARADLLKADPTVKFLGVTEVPCLSLAQLLSEYRALSRQSSEIDLMSVDVEGLELDVLQSNDWSRFRPKVLIVEILGLQTANGLLRTPTYRFLKERQYSLKAMTQNSFVFADCTLSTFSRYPELPLGPLLVH